ncbi:MAG: epoxyqueuosine reductase [Deltaproteobacteria bacterium]|nr:epoxyqueuosine reductase [Deltaproteobacteria bacterium]
MDASLRDEIARHVREGEANRFRSRDQPFFDAPLVGVAAAGDELFRRYKTIIGDFHRTPEEIVPGAAAVVVWVLPIRRDTRIDNRREKLLPARSWAETRSFGEEFNVALRRRVEEWLRARGFGAVAPHVASDWRRLEATPVGIASTWSERHAAYAAGLGTFGLSDGLITPLGIAHRLGSVVTTAPLRPTSSATDRAGPRGHCGFYDGEACTACIARCPVGAITTAGHDKVKCAEYVDGTLKASLAGPWGTPVPGCGLCQTKVPCEERIPPRRKPSTRDQ